MDAVREFAHYESPNHINYFVSPTDAFKTVTLRITFTLPLTEKDASANSIIPSVLRGGCAASPTLEALAKRCEELYGASIRGASTRAGRQQYLSVVVRFASPKYARGGAGYYREVLALARDLICGPLVTDGGFAPHIFDSEREQLARAIETLKDSKLSYAMQGAMRASFPGSPYGCAETGTEADVKRLERRDVYRRFEAVKRNAPLDMYLTGPVSVAEHLGPLVETFAGMERVAPKAVPLNRKATAPEKMVLKTERLEMEQAFVMLTHATGANVASRDFAAFRFANAVFGRLSTSRLFRVVREEHGLAYAVGSGLNDVHGLSVAYCGADPGEIKAAKKHMVEQLKKLQADGATKDEFEAARSTLVDEQESAQDSPGTQVGSLMVQRSCGTLISEEESLAQLKRVTPKQVHAALKKYKPVAEYWLMPK